MTGRRALPWIAALAALSAAGASLGGEPRARGRSPDYRTAVATIQSLASGKRPSVSTGRYDAGALENPAKLPAEGSGYRLAVASRATHFGSDALVFGLIELAALFRERHPEAFPLSIGDLSGPEGGKLAPHVNHQDGNDVDLAFLYCTPGGEPVDRSWLPVDGAGRARNAQDDRFDVERTFELLRLWLEGEWTPGFRWVLIHAPLKRLLVEHGRERGRREPEHRARLEAAADELDRVMLEPESSPHDDHLHVRLLKPGERRR